MTFIHSAITLKEAPKKLSNNVGYPFPTIILYLLDVILVVVNTPVVY